MIGCACGTCRSTDPRDARWRPSIFIEVDDGLRLLVDTSPDLRAQALRFQITRVDGILFTHSHADHVLGLDEVRRYNALQRASIPCFGDARTIHDVRRMFAYVFDPATPMAGGVPQLDTFVVVGPFCLGRVEITPVPILHGSRTIFGYRVGRFAYLTDCSAIPDASLPLVDGVDVLVLGALRDRPHPTHFTLAGALEASRLIAPRQAYFTHMCHDLAHAPTCARLPANAQLAYDGLVVEIEK